MNFPSKIDAWLSITLVGSAMVAGAAAYAVASRASGAGLAGAAVLLVVGLMLPLWLLVSTKYRIQDAHLLISSGPFRWDIPISEVTRVTPSKSILSCPALSLDR